MLQAATDRPLAMRPCIGPFIASFGISDILPLRAGDGFRVVWFHRQFGIPVGVLIGTMLVERLLDLTAILILGGVALILIGVSAPPMLVSGFQFVLAATFFAGIVIVFAPVLLAYIAERSALRIVATPAAALLKALHSTSMAVRQMGSWRRLVFLMVFSLICWVLESIVFLCAWWSLGGAAGEIAKPFLAFRSEEHTSELQSLMRISYAVFCLKK